MSQNDLRRHPPKHETLRHAEQHEPVLAQHDAVGTRQPCCGRGGVHEHRDPFEENGEQRQISRAARFDDVEDAGGEVRGEEAG